MMSASFAPLWTGADIAEAVGGVLSGDFRALGVSFDSREVVGGEVFIALRGETSDGHDHVAEALGRGAVGAVVERPIEGPHVRVPDSFAALQALGAAARARAATATVIGVTGSVGKTGCKEALRLSLQRTHPEATHWSVRSYNNHTGVPLSLARMPPDCRWAVFEMGMNHAGEIAALTRLVRPHVALVTWVASAHIENFPDGEPGIARAKAEIFAGLAPGGSAVIPLNNPHAPILAERAAAAGATIVGFGRSPGAAVRLLEARPSAGGTALSVDVAGERLEFPLALAGAHWVSNALAVLAAVHAAGGDIAEAALALGAMEALPGRGAVRHFDVCGGTATLIDESYNANPASMAAALAVLGATPAARRVAILGAMKELGERSAELHAALAGPIAAAGVDVIALVGEEMQALRQPGAVYLGNCAEALAWARATLASGDLLLVKGSNSVGLARLVSELCTPRTAGEAAA